MSYSITKKTIPPQSVLVTTRRVGPAEIAKAFGDGVRIDGLPGGEVAMTVHVGPYEGLGQASNAIQAWIGENSLTPAGAPWEVHITDPMATPSTAGWRTEVYWPVR